ncbi:unnamed protein product [marine sediment metagenome]|uniref:Terminase small subunit n=1 Tax=marine sediment metagenome TaxID=412755 RepID=X1CSW4_9ZZZZ
MSIKKTDEIKTEYKIFVYEYLTNGFDRVKAAEKAGYSAKTAHVQACRMLKNVKVQEEITKAFQDNGLMIQKSLEEVAKIAYSDIKDFIEIDDLTGITKVKPMNEIPEFATSVIHSIEEDRTIYDSPNGEQSTIKGKFKFKLYDKLKANELILKMAGKFIDRVDITTGGEPLEPTTFVFLGKDDELPERFKK